MQAHPIKSAPARAAILSLILASQSSAGAVAAAVLAFCSVYHLAISSSLPLLPQQPIVNRDAQDRARTRWGQEGGGTRTQWGGTDAKSADWGSWPVQGASYSLLDRRTGTEQTRGTPRQSPLIAARPIPHGSRGPELPDATIETLASVSDRGGKSNGCQCRRAVAPKEDTRGGDTGLSSVTTPSWLVSGKGTPHDLKYFSNFFFPV